MGLKPTYGELVGGIAFLAAVAVTAYIAIARTGDFASLALGAVIGVVGGGLGYFLRAKIQGPAGEEPPPSPPPDPEVLVERANRVTVERPLGDATRAAGPKPVGTV